VETDPDTWRRASLDEMDDEASRRFCEAVFRPELGANRLLSNRSIWFQATIVSNQTWRADNVILLGDALRTVHFSLGSGTRMAMQDAIALHRAFQACGDDLDAAFAAFEAERRPASASFQAAASRSLDWYERVAATMSLSPVEFAYHYMRRTGRVTDEHLRERDPEFMAAVEGIPDRRHNSA
jgi:2-polyprenyl-6-methoxyphenol hydroxylase-like FAD-dependent oxidoreductase